MGTGTVDTKGRRVAKRITRIMWIILAALFCWAIWKAFLQDIVPRERTLFLSYDSFVDKASIIKNTYPSELPSSAENIRYFHYRGGFDTKIGISFTVSRDEYQELKKRIVQFICQKRRKTGMSVSLYSTNGCPRNFWQKKNWIIWGRYSKIKQMITQYWLIKN